ncbi:MAG: D-alanine--D-alanine ligase [Caldisericia bacterium]|nr:D-alanine--D-alanine ligase [Caldisericia bacterium]
MINILLIFGGISPEHEISVVSTRTILSHLDPEKYNPILLGISKTGKWKYFTAETFSTIKSVEEDPEKNDSLLVDVSQQNGLYINKDFIKIDCAFPILHGKGGEDGSIQGFLKTSGIPFVGCGVESSSICMNKILTKIVLEKNNIPTSPYEVVSKIDFESGNFNPDKLIEKFDLPLFIKGPHGGSSIGVIKVNRPDQLYSAILEALENESEVLVEKSNDGREIECSVLSIVGKNKTTKSIASLPGEIKPTREFYDYTAKYIEDSTKLIIPANLSKNQIERIQSVSISTYNVLKCFGMARIDCFLSSDNDSDDNILISEVNTIPGFTAISMYPSLWETSGISTAELIDNLVQTALLRKDIDK